MPIFVIQKNRFYLSGMATSEPFCVLLRMEEKQARDMVHELNLKARKNTYSLHQMNGEKIRIGSDKE